VFSEPIHSLRLSRAKARYAQGNDFLMQWALTDIIERLSTVNLEFENAVLLFARSANCANQVQTCKQIKHLLRVEEAEHVGAADHIATPDFLNLPPASAELIIAPLTLHWSNDLPGTLVQILQCLKPNGLFLASLPGPETLKELRASLLQAESELRDGAASRLDPMTDIRDAGALLQRIGFSIPVVDQQTVTVRYNGALDLVRDLRSFGATLHLRGGNKPPLTRAMMERVVEIYAERFSDPDGRVRASFSSIALSGWSPHESQQKPLRPGSATSRLSDALMVDEVKLKG
jgi:SAM-dependent methyltransferase